MLEGDIYFQILFSMSLKFILLCLFCAKLGYVQIQTCCIDTCFNVHKLLSTLSIKITQLSSKNPCYSNPLIFQLLLEQQKPVTQIV